MLGSILQNNKEYDQALNCINEAIQFVELKENPLEMATGLASLGLIYKDMNQLDSALVYLNQSHEIIVELEEMESLAMGYLNLGEVYRLKGNYSKAQYFGKKSFAVGQELDHKSAISGSAELLYKTYKATGNNSLALEMHENYIAARDTIQSEKNQKEIIRQEFLKRAEADSLQHASEQEIAETRLISQTQKTNFRTAGFILFGILSGFLFYLYNQLRKANKTTKHQAEEIKQTNSELSSALGYQKMLQGEIHHRVKNNLQVIISLLELQKGELTDPQAQEGLDSLSNRIYSMSAIHDVLYQKDSTMEIGLSDYIDKLCKHFGDFSSSKFPVQFDLDIDDVQFNLATLTPLGIIITELLNNSFKYAHPDENQLKISMKLKKKTQIFNSLTRTTEKDLSMMNLKKEKVELVVTS